MGAVDCILIIFIGSINPTADWILINERITLIIIASITLIILIKISFFYVGLFFYHSKLISLNITTRMDMKLLIKVRPINTKKSTFCYNAFDFKTQMGFINFSETYLAKEYLSVKMKLKEKKEELEVVEEKKEEQPVCKIVESSEDRSYDEEGIPVDESELEERWGTEAQLKRNEFRKGMVETDRLVRVGNDRNLLK